MAVCGFAASSVVGMVKTFELDKVSPTSCSVFRAFILKTHSALTEAIDGNLVIKRMSIATRGAIEVGRSRTAIGFTSHTSLAGTTASKVSIFGSFLVIACHVVRARSLGSGLGNQAEASAKADVALLGRDAGY